MGNKLLYEIFAFIYSWILISLLFMQIVPLLMAIIIGFLVVAFLFWLGAYKVINDGLAIVEYLKGKNHEQISLFRRIKAKLHLMAIRKKWQKSSHSRHIPAMARKLKKWAKTNPDIKSVISVVLSQMQDLATATCIFEDILKDSEFGYRGQESRQAFEFTVSQIRRNFIDIYNLLILAGANQGKATTKTLDQIALARELNSNRIKLELLNNLNAEVVQFVNQVDSAYDNAMMEAEIEFIARKNAARLGTQPSPISHLNAGAESDTAVPSAGVATSQPSATASSASTSQTP